MMAPPQAGLEAVLGHAPAVRELREQLQSGSVAHAYWMVGPPQVGKTTLALALAAELLQAAAWPGGLLAHPDLWLDDEDGSLGIERVRGPESERGPSLQHFLSLASYTGRGQVVVIGNADRLTLPAANGLLRLLEEPPPGSVICLCTARPESEHLPPTLRSRCQQLGLGPVAEPEIERWLRTERGESEEAARFAASLARGRPGQALELARDPGLRRWTEEQLEAFLACAGQGAAEWLELSRGLAERGKERSQVVVAVRAWAGFLRDCCCLAIGAPERARWPQLGEAARLWAGALGPAACSARYDLALDALSRLAEAATPRLVLDRLLLLTLGGPPPHPPATPPQFPA